MSTNYYNPNPQFQQNPYGGMVYAQPQPQIQMTDTLTPELKKALTVGKQFTLNMDVNEQAIGACCHRDANKQQFTTITNPDGTMTCTQCGQTFDPSKADTEEKVDEAIDNFINVIQCIKLYGLELSPEVVHKGISPLMMLAAKMKPMYKVQKNKFDQYLNIGEQAVYSNAQNNTLQMYQNLMTPGGLTMFQQPQMMQPMYGQPQMVQQPAYNAQQMTTMGMNPFYQPAQPAPQQPMMAPNPVTPPQQVAQQPTAQQAAPQEVTVSQPVQL